MAETEADPIIGQQFGNVVVKGILGRGGMGAVYLGYHPGLDMKVAVKLLPDLFVGRKGHYLGISGSAGSHAWARHVPVFDGSKICVRNGRKVARKAGAI